MVSFLLSVTFACGVVIAVSHVINRRFVAPVYDVVAKPDGIRMCPSRLAAPRSLGSGDTVGDRDRVLARSGPPNDIGAPRP